MKLYLVAGLGLLAFCPLQAQGPLSLRRIVEFDGFIAQHTYRPDDGNSFRYGTRPVELGLSGGGGIGRAGKPFGFLDMAGVHETIATKSLPPPVVTAANAFRYPVLDLEGKTSLRKQDAWGFSGGVYIARNLQVGGRYNRDSWRYDWLGKPAGTTIPYLKGVMDSKTAFVRGSADAGSIQFLVDAGVGAASARFLKGEESYLKDGDGGTLSQVSGITVPVSVRIGFYALRGKDSPLGADASILPYVRYDVAYARLGGTQVVKRQFVFGVEMAFAVPE